MQTSSLLHVFLQDHTMFKCTVNLIIGTPIIQTLFLLHVLAGFPSFLIQYTNLSDVYLTV